VSQIRKEQKPGLFVPMIDRTKCEGGYHHACADAKCPCVPACPYSEGARFRFEEPWDEKRRQSILGEGTDTDAGDVVAQSTRQVALPFK
jgi:hypothetical protein